MKLTARVEALESRAEARQKRYVVIYEFPAGEAAEIFGVSGDGPEIELIDCRTPAGVGCWWLVLRRAPTGLTDEQAEAIHAVDSDPSAVVISRLRF